MRLIVILTLVASSLVASETELDIVNCYLDKFSNCAINKDFNEKLTKRVKSAQSDAEIADRVFSPNTFVNEILVTWFEARRNIKPEEYGIVDRCYVARMYTYYLLNKFEFPDEIKELITVSYFKQFFKVE